MNQDGKRHTDELIQEIHSDVKVLCVKVDGLERCVIIGNGGASLLERTAKLERWRSYVLGGLKASGIVLAALGAALLAALKLIPDMVAWLGGG